MKFALFMLVKTNDQYFTVINFKSFQLSRYNLEKKVQEQERQLHVQNSSRENYLTQVNQLEQNCLSVSKQASDVTEHMERLQANGRHTRDTFQGTGHVCNMIIQSRKLWSCIRSWSM